MQVQILKRLSRYRIPTLCSHHQTAVTYAMLICQNYFLNCYDGLPVSLLCNQLSTARKDTITRSAQRLTGIFRARIYVLWLIPW